MHKPWQDSEQIQEVGLILSLITPIDQHSLVALKGEIDSASDKPVSRMESSRDYARSLYERDTTIDEEYVVSDLEESDDDSKTRTGIPEKANRILGLNPSREQQLRSNTPTTTTKAQRILGKNKQQPGALPFDPFEHQFSHVDTENIAPKALRTLGIPSRALSRPMTTHQENPPQQVTTGVPFDPDDFKKLLVSSQRPILVDTSSSTDASSLSRESTVSWRTETPRSSQEVYLEDLRWKNLPPIYSQRTDSLVDPNAVLTEPFSPLSIDSPYNKPLPAAPGAFSFELPADVPMSPYIADKPHFIAELSAEPEVEPIYEMADSSQEIAELPAELPAETVDTHVVQKNAEIGIDHPHFPELDSYSPPKEQYTKVVGEPSPLKIYPSRPRVSTIPLTQVVIPPVIQSSGIDPIAADLVHPLFRRPTVPGIQPGSGDGQMRARSSEGVGRLRRDKMTKSKSTEFALSGSIVESPISPQSPSAGLGMIAAKAAIAAQRKASPINYGRGLAARSKYNPEMRALKPRSSHGSYSSLKEQILADRDRDDTTPMAEPVVVKAAPVEDYPESPVTGYIAGHPTFNKSFSEEATMDPKEILAKLDFPKAAEETGPSQPAITFSKKEGFI